MKYISTRGLSPAKTFTEILLGGLAPDGGLYLPEKYPQVTRTELDVWRDFSYADLVDVTRMHTADPEHRVPHLAFQPDQLSDLPILAMDEVITSYYLRMRVQDKPGVLADITRILADEQISIDAVIQKEPGEGEDQTDLIMLTHQTRERRINAAIAKVEALPIVAGKVTRLRLEQLG